MDKVKEVVEGLERVWTLLIEYGIKYSHNLTNVSTVSDDIQNSITLIKTQQARIEKLEKEVKEWKQENLTSRNLANLAIDLTEDYKAQNQQLEADNASVHDLLDHAEAEVRELKERLGEIPSEREIYDLLLKTANLNFGVMGNIANFTKSLSARINGEVE